MELKYSQRLNDSEGVEDFSNSAVSTAVFFNSKGVNSYISYITKSLVTNMERELFAQSVLTNLFSRISPLWGLDGTTKEKPHLKVSQFNGFLWTTSTWF